MTASLPQPNRQSGTLDMLRRAVGPSPAERALGAAAARPTPAERALGAVAGKPTAAEKALGLLAGRPTPAERALGIGQPGGLTLEEKMLGVKTPGGPTLTERLRGVKKRGGKSPMEKLSSMVTPPTMDTSLSGMLDRLSGPAVDTSFPQLDRPVTSLFRADPREFTYVSDIDRATDDPDPDVVLDAEPDVADIAHYSAATDAIDEVREWLARFCPSALTKIEGASHAFDGGGPDYEAQVAVSCRRALEHLADVLCPAVPEKKSDRNGMMRELGQENYGNRLLRYLDMAQADDGQYRLVAEQMAFFGFTVEHLIDRCQKGVHYQGTKHETRRIVSLTWSILSELAQVASR